MSTYLKICGIRRAEDVDYLCDDPPDYAGFICSKPFWRYVSPSFCYGLSEILAEGIKPVGVFVNPTLDEIGDYAGYGLLRVIQLHGEETADFIAQVRERFPALEIWKAARVKTPEDIAKADALPVDKLVLDSFSAQSVGGTGALAPWDLIAKNRPTKPFLLAGGISPENVRQAIEEVQPWGVDVSSGVETHKVKDKAKIRAMVAAVRIK